MKREVHFPACGFGFWYLFGVYIRNQKRLNRCILSGSSGGALICLCSLLPDKSRNYKTIMRIAKRVSETKTTNLYEIIYMFVDELIELIEIDEQRLKRIRIQVAKLETSFPFVSKVHITPSNLAELREACIASAYIPFISNYNNQLYYGIGDSRYIDGGLFDYIGKNENTIQVPFNFVGLRMPTEEECKNRFNEGLKIRV
jgi:hypothetical protein